MKKIIYLLLSVCLLCTTSCKKEEQHKEITPTDNRLQQAIDFLKGEVVLGQKVKMQDADKTRLPEGCPTKYTFTWMEKDKKFKMALQQIQPGSMPFAVSLVANLSVMELTDWEKDEYKGNWIKLYDDKAKTYPYNEDNPEAVPDVTGTYSVVKGFYNVDTHEIEFGINYNVMNVTGYIFKQVIDKNRTANYQDDLRDYEEELAEWKLDHGDETLSPYKKYNQMTIDQLNGTHTLTATITYGGQTVTAALPITFKWDEGAEADDIKPHMQVSLTKTEIVKNHISLSFEGKARFHQIMTKIDKTPIKKELKALGMDLDHARFRKLKAVGVSTKLYNPAGEVIKSSSKGVLRVIDDNINCSEVDFFTKECKDADKDTKKKRVTLTFEDKSIGLEIKIPFTAIE